MTENNLNILDSIPLTEVMAGWGYSAQHQNAKGTAAWYVCPWHGDKDPSLAVERDVREGATAPMFKCYGCGAVGYGAIQLAARLMGKPAGKLAAADLQEVLGELATRCDVELEPEADDEGRRWQRNLRSSIVGWGEFRQTELQYDHWTGDEPVLEPGEWTADSLRALGLKVEMATRKARRDDIPAEGTAAEIRVGDLVTQTDADTGEPLYRCSFGAGYYGNPKDAEVKTIREWGDAVERTFRVKPVGRILRRLEPADKGGAVVQVVR